jgi:hypothetical protein
MPPWRQVQLFLRSHRGPGQFIRDDNGKLITKHRYSSDGPRYVAQAALFNDWHKTLDLWIQTLPAR